MTTYKWTQSFPATTPNIFPLSYVEVMTFDVARNRMVLFGFRDVAPFDALTFEYYAGNWHLVTTAHTITGTSGGRAGCYDKNNGVVVLLNDAVIASVAVVQTWTYDGVDWTLRSPATSPPWGLAGEENIVFDDTNNEVVLFGEIGGVRSTWTWNGTTWLNKAPATQPSFRYEFGFAYDPVNQNCVLFGGQHGFVPSYNDTWIWDGTTWTEVFPATVPPLYSEASMTYDESIGKVLLWTPNYIYFWDGTDWEEASLTADFSLRAWTSVRYDNEVEKTMGWGGGVGVNETWFFEPNPTEQPSSWELQDPAATPGAREKMVGGYDSVRDNFVIFGGYAAGGVFPGNPTYTYNGSTWTLRAPATSPGARTDSAMAWDVIAQNMVMYGGYSGFAGLSDTWVWNGTTWTQKFPATVPSARGFHSMAYDPIREQTVMFGGFELGGPTGPTNQTWVWNGTNWTLKTPAHAPSPRRAQFGMTMGFDEISERVILFGGDDLTTVFEDTWAWDGTDWEQLFPADSPSPAANGEYGVCNAMTWHDSRNCLVMPTIAVDGPVAVSNTWEWVGGNNWSKVLTCSEPEPRFYPAVGYFATLDKTILFGGQDFEDVDAGFDQTFWYPGECPFTVSFDVSFAPA